MDFFTSHNYREENRRNTVWWCLRRKPVLQVVREGFITSAIYIEIIQPCPSPPLKCIRTHERTWASIRTPPSTQSHTQKHTYIHIHFCIQEYLNTSEIRHILSRSYTMFKGNANYLKTIFQVNSLRKNSITSYWCVLCKTCCVWWYRTEWIWN